MCKLELTNELYAQLRRLAYRVVFNKQDAEDLVQEAMIKATKRNDFEPTHVLTYFHDARAAMLTRLRANKRQQREDAIIEEAEPVEERLNYEQQRLQVHYFLCSSPRLPTAQKIVLAHLAQDIEGAQQYLRKQYGLSKPLVSYHFKQAALKLTSHLREKGVIK